MSNRLNEQLVRLRELNVELRRSLEVAEAKVHAANQLLGQLASLGLLSEQLLLGPVILSRAYSTRWENTGTGQLIMAAMSLPGGLGAIYWDSEELAEVRDSPQLVQEAHPKFTPFEQCEPAIKTLVYPHLEALLDELIGPVQP